MRHGLRPTLAAAFLSLIVASWPKAGRGDDPAPHPPSPWPPDTLIGVRIAPLLLLCRPEIRADVGLDPRQTAELEGAIAALHPRAAALRGQTGTAAVAARKAIDEAMQRWIDAHLSEAQRVRLIQIDLQWEGPAALISRPVIADALSLTRAQRETLGQAVAEYHRKRLSGTFRESDVEHLAKVSYGLLSEEQRLRYNAMRGEPMKLAPRVAAGGQQRTAK